MKDYDCIVKVSHKGIKPVNAVFRDGQVVVKDTIENTTLLVVYRKGINDIGEYLELSYNKIISAERSLAFDPINYDSDYDLLKKETGNY